MRFTLFLGVIVVFNFSVFAQGLIFQRGESGFSAGGGFSINNDATGISGNLGYTIDGLVNFTGQIGHSAADEGDLTAFSIAPIVTFYPIKYSYERPITIAITGGYIYTKFSSDALDLFNVDLTANTWGLVGGITGHYYISQTGQIMPGFAFEYNKTTVKLKNNLGNSVEDDDNFSYLILSLGFGFETTPTFSFLIVPQIAFGLSGEGNDATTFGLGVTFGFK